MSPSHATCQHSSRGVAGCGAGARLITPEIQPLWAQTSTSWPTFTCAAGSVQGGDHMRLVEWPASVRYFIAPPTSQKRRQLVTQAKPRSVGMEPRKRSSLSSRGASAAGEAASRHHSSSAVEATVPMKVWSAAPLGERLSLAMACTTLEANSATWNSEPQLSLKSSNSLPPRSARTTSDQVASSSLRSATDEQIPSTSTRDSRHAQPTTCVWFGCFFIAANAQGKPCLNNVRLSSFHPPSRNLFAHLTMSAGEGTLKMFMIGPPWLPSSELLLIPWPKAKRCKLCNASMCCAESAEDPDNFATALLARVQCA
mmetsp:Transcript_36305/g.117371  ORF Transcript_36305/g.117371 Transcript_36305/m.117371 type:complete len:312 (-) Transcript_36305:3288-4223(-)